MKNSKAQAVVTGSLVITLIIGTLNKLYKTGQLPKFRFFAGTGVLYLMLSGLAEFEEEIAKNIAIAVLVFTVVGEGGGVIDNFLGQGTASHTLDTRPKNQGDVHSPDITRRNTGINATVGTAFQYPIRPDAIDSYRVDLRLN